MKPDSHSDWTEDRGSVMGIGSYRGAVDATVETNYDTAVPFSKGTLTGVAAYMNRKLRVRGDLMKLMQLEGVLSEIPSAASTLAIDYPAESVPSSPSPRASECAIQTSSPEMRTVIKKGSAESLITTH